MPKIKAVYFSALILSILFLASDAYAAHYYVDPAGSDSNNGTATGSAWRTVNKVNNFSLVAGDIVSFKSGGFWNETLIPRSGTNGHLVTYGSYGVGSKPALDKVNASNKSYVKIAGLSFESASTVINLTTANHIIVDGCDINSASTTWNPAIVIQTGSNYNQITNCTITQSEGANDTINVRGDAYYNLIAGNNITVTNVHAAIDLEGHTGNGKAWYNIVKDNIITGSKEGGMLLNIGSDSSYTLVEGNVLSGDGTLDAYCGVNTNARHQAMFKLVTLNNIVRNNIVKNYPCKNSLGITMEAYTATAAYGGYENIASGNHVYNNIITGIGPGGAALYLGNTDSGECSNNVFKNNAIYGNGGTNLDFTINGMPDGSWGVDSIDQQMKVKVSSAVQNNTFKNNLFYRPGANNILWVNNSFKSVDQASIWDSVHFVDNVQSDPLFDSNFIPQSGSEVIDGGDFLAKVTSSNGSGTSFYVDDAYFFFDGNGIIDGDMIRVGNATAQITNIDYSNNRITVTPSISWINGDAVSLEYYGSKPDIGVFEFSDVPPAAPTGMMVI